MISNDIDANKPSVYSEYSFIIIEYNTYYKIYILPTKDTSYKYAYFMNKMNYLDFCCLSIYVFLYYYILENGKIFK